MRPIITSIAITAACLSHAAETPVVEHHGKSIYIPVEFRDSNRFDSPQSKWAYSRMALTENVALFWAPGFGPNLSTAPDLDGQPMHVDLPLLLERLEQFYHYYAHDLGFLLPGSLAERHRMMVMLDYSLEGTAYGGDYDSRIGALWVAPNRLRDPRLNCIAHELGHSFQSQITCDGQGDAWGGCGFFEMTSQWMLWQVNPDWPTDENYHLNAFRTATHKAFLHLDNIYRSPYVLEGWAQRHGLKHIAHLFREGKVGEDPAQTYMRVNQLTQSQMNDEMLRIQAQFINWDFPRVYTNMRPYANLWSTELSAPDLQGWQKVSTANCPENYGFNPIDLSDRLTPGVRLRIDFKGITSDSDYFIPDATNLGWRYALVEVLADGSTRYGKTCAERSATISYRVPADNSVTHLWLIVMGAPQRHIPNPADPTAPCPQHPYKIRIR